MAFSAILFSAIVCLRPAYAGSTSSSAPKPRTIEQAGRPAAANLTVLIAKLGDPQYAVRQQAQEELAKLGPEAFDALVAAEDNDDLEIAARPAIWCICIRIDWIHETDSPLVKEALDRLRHEKRARSAGGRAAAGSDAAQRGARAVVPIDSLREDRRWSPKRVRSDIMLQPEAAESAWPQQAKQILRALAGSDRARLAGCEIMFVATTIRKRLLRIGTSWSRKNWPSSIRPIRKARRNLQNLLMRNYAKMLLARQHRDRAIAVMRKMIGRVSDNVDSLISFVDWLVEQKAWEVVDETARQFDRTFAADRTLLYAEAQSFKARGDEASAEKYADAGVQDRFDRSGRRGRPIRYGAAALCAWHGRLVRTRISPDRRSRPARKQRGVEEPKHFGRNVSRPGPRRRSRRHVAKAGRPIEAEWRVRVRKWPNGKCGPA